MKEPDRSKQETPAPEKKPWVPPEFLFLEVLESVAGVCAPGNGKTAFDGTPACNLNPNS